MFSVYVPQCTIQLLEQAHPEQLWSCFASLASLDFESAWWDNNDLFKHALLGMVKWHNLLCNLALRHKLLRNFQKMCHPRCALTEWPRSTPQLPEIGEWARPRSAPPCEWLLRYDLHDSRNLLVNLRHSGPRYVQHCAQLVSCNWRRATSSICSSVRCTDFCGMIFTTSKICSCISIEPGLGCKSHHVRRISQSFKSEKGRNKNKRGTQSMLSVRYCGSGPQAQSSRHDTQQSMRAMWMTMDDCATLLRRMVSMDSMASNTPINKTSQKNESSGLFWPSEGHKCVAQSDWLLCECSAVLKAVTAGEVSGWVCMHPAPPSLPSPSLDLEFFDTRSRRFPSDDTSTFSVRLRRTRCAALQHLLI